jgi:asparagine synthase (glutamine-hydrolysing)
MPVVGLMVKTTIESRSLAAPKNRLRNHWLTRRLLVYFDSGAYNPVETFRELLSDAVKLRLRSDVPVGIALSGGVDSSSILGLAGRFMDASRLKMFTAVFPGEGYDESEYAGIASEAAGAELFCINYQPRDFMQDLRRVVWSLDYPALEGQTLARWELMRIASGHVKVILEGQGADEMLAGYVGRYFPAYMFDELGRTTRGRRDDLSVRELIASSLEVHNRCGLHAYEGLVRQIAPRWLPLRAIRNLWADSRIYTRDFMQRNPGRQETPGALFEDRLNALLHFDHEIAILPMLLKFGDALSMASSVESRVPFLDHRLVEFVFRLPAHYKLRGSVSKGILREAMAGIVPDQILRRNDKIGFATPVGRWIAGCMDSGVRPVLLSKRCRERGIFDVKKIEKLLDKQARGQASVEHSIFRWLSVELWFRLFMDGEGIAESTAIPESKGIKV